MPLAEEYNVSTAIKAPTIGQTYKPRRPTYSIATIHDDETTMAQKLGMDVLDFQKQFPEGVNAGAAYMPTYQGLTEKEAAYGSAVGLGSAIFEDFLKTTESKTVGGLSKFAPYYSVDEKDRVTRLGGFTAAPAIPRGETAESTEARIQYPAGWNPEYAKWFLEQTEESGYMDAWKNLNLDLANLMNLPTMGITSQKIDPRYQSYTVNELEEMGYGDYALDLAGKGVAGMPSTAFYDIGVGGGYERLDPEAIFDELYEYNGIDPNDPDMVELFWSYAPDDLLYLGEYFDAIEWPSERGYGGYGGYDYPTSRGRTPFANRDYNAYLQLTSWSI